MYHQYQNRSYDEHNDYQQRRTTYQNPQFRRQYARDSDGEQFAQHKYSAQKEPRIGDEKFSHFVKSDKIDTLHQIYSNPKIKQQLIDYIYSIVDLSNYKYKILNTPEDLQLLKMNKFYISGNYAGTPCLLVFTTNKDRSYSYLVNKKMLTYNKAQINIDTIALEPIDIGLDKHIYDGTIIDGILLSKTQSEAKRTFIITDMYYFRGENVTGDKLRNKLTQIKIYLEECLNDDENLNNLVLTVINLYEPNEIEKLSYDIIPLSKIPIKGITFYPDVSGTKIMYMFDAKDSHLGESSRIKRSQDIVPATFDVKDSHLGESRHVEHRQMYVEQYKEKETYHHVDDEKYTKISEHPINKTSYRYVRKQDVENDIVLTFELRKTEQSDVYKLILVTKQMDGGRSVLKTKHMGIAYIPTIDCSKMCKELTSTNGRALVKCKYDDAKEKWIPIEENNVKKYPDTLDTFESMMDTIIDEE